MVVEVSVRLCDCAVFCRQPIRVVIVGPPAVGKTTVAKQMCEHYQLHHIQLSETISETISQLVNTSAPT